MINDIYFILNKQLLYHSLYAIHQTKLAIICQHQQKVTKNIQIKYEPKLNKLFQTAKYIIHQQQINIYFLKLIQMTKPISQKQQAESITIDMHLLQQFSKSKQKNQPSPILISNINTLSNLLTYKNSKYKYSNQQRQRDQGWVIAKKVTLQPLINRAKQAQKNIYHYHIEHQKQQNCYFYINVNGIVKQNQHISKNLEYFTFGVVNSVLASNNYVNDRLNKKKKLGKLNANIVQRINYQPMPTNLVKSPMKVQAYLKAINQLFQNKSTTKQWIQSFKATTRIQLWEILYNLQPKNYGYQAKSMNNSRKMNNKQQIMLNKMAIYSLKMVEAEFNSTLPSNYESIVYYLTSNYLRKMQKKYQTSGILGPIWGIAFLLYRAGRKKQFYQYLPDLELRNKFKIADQLILLQKPQIIQNVQTNGDIFHDQLIYALSGVSKYSSQVLFDPSKLDIAWVLLRNLAIFPERQQKFHQLQQDIYNSYKNTSLTQIKIKNLLYLLCFDQLIQIGPNQFIDQNDYLHFLIVLYHSQTFNKIIKNKKGLLQKKFIQYVLQFIYYLLTNNRKQALFYISLMPTQYIPQQISNLIVQTKQFQKIKWKQLAKLLDFDIYRELVAACCCKQVQFHEEYILAAQKIKQLLGDCQLALKFLIKMQIKWCQNRQIQQNKLYKVQNMIKSYLSENQKLQLQYSPIFQFFQQHRNLLKLISQRNQQKLYNYLKNCKHILNASQLRINTQKVLQKLIQQNAFDCYMSYMKDIAKAYQITFTKLNKLYDLQDIQRLTLSAIIGFINTAPYTKYAKRQSVLDFIKLLEDGLYRFR